MPLLDTQYTKISGTAAGTTVISDRGCYLDKVIFPSSATGTAVFYDTPLAAGSAAGNAIITLDLNSVGTAKGMPFVYPIGARTQNGLITVVSGTVGFTVIWG